MLVYFLKESTYLQCYLNYIRKIFVKEMESPHAVLFKFLTTYSLIFASNQQPLHICNFAILKL